MRPRDCASDVPSARDRDNGGSSRTLTALALVALFWAAAFAQWPLRDLVVPWDSKNQFYTFFRFMAEAIAQGATPFWNPYHYAGHPSIADPQSMIFSPAFVLWALVDPKPSMLAFDLMVFAHLLVGGLALVRYGQRRDWPTPACVLAAMIFMIGGAVSGRMMHVGVIIAYALFPVALLWMEIAIDRRSRLAAVGFGAVSALIVLGRSQVPLLLCFTLGLLLLWRLARDPGGWRFAASRLGVLALAALTTLAIIAIPMLLTIQFADFSNRPHEELEAALRSSLYPANLANFFVPDIYGSLRPLPQGNWGPAYFTRPDVDSTDRAFNYLFAGTLTALLLVWHGLAGGRALRREARPFLAMLAIALLYAFGRYSPLFPFLFEHVPGVDLFRRPVGGTFVLLIGLAYLTGFLAAAYVRDGAPKPRAHWLIAALLGAGAILAWALVFSARGLDAAWEIAKALPLYAALAALLAWPQSPRARVIALSVAVAFTAGELILRNAATVLNAEPRSVYAMLEAPTEDSARIVAAIQQDMQKAPGGVAHPRVEIVGLGGPWQNAAMLYGLEATNGYNPLRIGPYDRLVSPGEAPYTALHRRFPSSFPGYNCLLSRLLGLEYVVLDRPIDQVPSLARRRTIAEAVMTGPKTWIYRLANVSPRVTVETRVQVADASEMIDAGAFPATLPSSEVLVDSDDTLSQKYMSGPIRAKAAIVARRADRIEIDFDSPAPGVVTLHDLWYPGWEVEVDGVRRPLLRTDLLFRGVEAPAGKHRIVFAYRPLSRENLLSIIDGLLQRDEG
ncbi:MAG TPA: hypothetical protein PKA55_13785 [Rhodoblastus sp.]|nr:hypothetical protein [Rhodoblastus sp.]